MSLQHVFTLIKLQTEVKAHDILFTTHVRPSLWYVLGLCLHQSKETPVSIIEQIVANEISSRKLVTKDHRRGFITPDIRWNSAVV